MLNLSPNLSLPLDTVTQTIAILAKKRRGKTYTASVLAEEMVKAKLPFVALDPTGAWWGLRSSADGKHAGLPVVVIGGAHADIPLEATAGAVIADLVVDHPGHYIIDLSLLDEDELHTFAADFGERLFLAKASARFPMMLYVDEADAVLPQAPQSKAHHRALRAYDRIVRRAGIYGLGVCIISQRPALINKNSLSQVECLIALQIVGAADQEAVDRWVKSHDTRGKRDEFMKSLSSLGLGEAWVWSPAWLNVFKRVQIRERETFNSSKTPEVGDKVLAPKVLAQVDLDAVRERVAATIEKVKSNDPDALKARIRSLQSELLTAKAPVQIIEENKPRRVEVPVLKPADIKRVEGIAERYKAIGDKLAACSQDFYHEGSKLLDALAKAVRATDRQSQPAAAAPAQTRPAYSRPDTEVSSRPAIADSGTLGKGERVVLTAIAQNLAQGVTREQLTVLTGYKRASRNTFIQRISAAGLVSFHGEKILALPAGLKALGPDFQPLPTGEALRQHWSETLSGGEQKILHILIQRYPGAVDREELTNLTGYKRASRNTFLQRLGARQLVESVGGAVKASDLLF